MDPDDAGKKAGGKIIIEGIGEVLLIGSAILVSIEKLRYSLYV